MEKRDILNKFPQNMPDGTINPEWLTINNILAAEQDNSSSFIDSNGNQISPKGKPCN